MVRAVALDVDGVLTDGTFWWGADGEMKRFHFLDVMGIARALRGGVVFALISGENSPIVGRFAEKLGIQDVFVGCKDNTRFSMLRVSADNRGLLSILRNYVMQLYNLLVPRRGQPIPAIIQVLLLRCG